jgi:hypothetical protein
MASHLRAVLAEQPQDSAAHQVRVELAGHPELLPVVLVVVLHVELVVAVELVVPVVMV